MTKMDGEAKVVACAACGHVMKIPPQYADTPGRCGRCGATVNDRVLIPAIDLSDLGPPSPKKKTSAAVQNSETFSITVRRALLAGLAGALVGGGVVGAFFTIRRTEGQAITPGTLFANANTGLVLGFTICSLFFFVKHLNWGPFRAAGAGMLSCVVIGSVMFLLEARLVAPPDIGLFAQIAMAAMAGGVAGLIMGAKLNNED
ncbi:MAG TPA: hypothetical protein P5318_16435 [Candidatus Hydrogenedentes bacterium]|nr:hypothetical protein [Candidatus Hydrogenedentota bacterium]HRT21704.1 hypothetical protein [Candidatus Hydrogenedentota bacterium]HRT66545.1 hypothetical protein [Candidatus Hydrogenedentota bacterium]